MQEKQQKIAPQSVQPQAKAISSSKRFGFNQPYIINETNKQISLVSPQLVGRLCWRLAQDASVQKLIETIEDITTNSDISNGDQIKFSLSFIAEIQSIGSEISKIDSKNGILILSGIILGLLSILYMLIFIQLYKQRLYFSKSKSKSNSGLSCFSFLNASRQNTQNDNDENETEKGDSRILSVAIIIFSSILYQPLLDVTINMASNSYINLNDSSLQVGILVVNIFSTVMIVMLFIIARKFIKINSPTSHLNESKLTRIGHHVSLGCWSEPDSNISYLNLLSKILIVILLSLNLSESYILSAIIGIIIVLGLNLLGGFILQLRSMQFNKNVRAINLVSMFTVFFILICGLIRKTMTIRDEREGILLALVYGFLVVAILKSQLWYKKTLLAKYIENIKPTSSQMTKKEKQVKELTALQRLSLKLRFKTPKTIRASQYKSTDIDLDQNEAEIKLKQFNFNKHHFQGKKRAKNHETHSLKEAELESLFIILLENTASCLNKFHKASFSSQINIFDWEELNCLIGLIEVHQASCEDINCPCTFYSNFMDSFNTEYSLGVEQIRLSSKKFSKVFKFLTTQQRSTQFKSNLSKIVMGIDNMRESQDQAEDFALSMSFNGKIFSRKESSTAQEKLGTINQVKEVKGEKDFIISQEQAFSRFLVEFTNIFLKDIRLKAPESDFIENCYNYFHLFLNERPHLALVSLLQEGGRILKRQNKSWTRQITKVIQEQFVLHYFDGYASNLNIIDPTSEIQVIELEEQDNQQNKNAPHQIISPQQKYQQFDAEKFIQLNTNYQSFHADVETLCHNTIEFWSGFNQEVIEPYVQLKIGDQISTSMKKIYDRFTDIEDSLIQKDPKLYFWFGMVQLKIVNDTEAYNLFIAKMKEIQQFQKTFIKKFSDKQFDHDSGFLISDGKLETSGQILMANKNLRRWLKYDGEEIRHKNIKSVMPLLIAQNHDAFSTSYASTGHSKIQNKKLTLFLIDKDQSLVLCSLIVQFHYSHQFGYCFVALVDRIEKASPFSDSLKYSTERIVFLTFDLENGQILETSENLGKVVERAGVSLQFGIKSYIFKEKVIKIDDLLDNINFMRNKKEWISQSDNPNVKNSHEGIYQVDFSSFNDDADIKSLRGNAKLLAKIAVFIEQFSYQGIQFGYMALSFFDTENKSFHGSFNESPANFFVSQDLIKNDSDILENERRQEEMILSSSAGSSVSSTENVFAFDIRKFHNFYQQRTPRILRIVVQLILLLFISSLTIATINLSLSIYNSSSTSFDLSIVRASYSRINYTINNRLILRILLNIANGYEPNYSSITTDRFSTFQKMQLQRINDLKDANDYLVNSGYSESAAFAAINSASSLKLLYLTDRNQIETQNATMKIAQSLFISRLQQINNLKQQDFKGNLRIQTLFPNLSSSYIPTQNEESLFFALNNSNGVMRENNWVFMNQYVTDTKNKSSERQQQAITLAVISIVTILTVTLIVAPIISKAEERKLYSLIFFTKLPLERVQYFLERSSTCLKIQEESNLENVAKFKMRNGEINLSVEHLSFDDKSSIQNYGISIIDDSGFPSIDQFSLNPKAMQRRSDVNFDSSLKKFNSKSVFGNQETNSIEGNSAISFYQKQQSTSVQVTPQNALKRKITQLQSQFRRTSKNIDKTIKMQASDKYVIEQSDSKSKDLSSHRSSSADQFSQTQRQLIEGGSLSYYQSAEPRTLEEVVKAKHSPNPAERAELDSNQQQKIKQIKVLALQKKLKVLSIIILMALVFSVYFIATFLLQINSFTMSTQAVTDLNFVFNKEVCFENLLTFQRENQIQNYSITYSEKPKVVASSDLVVVCQTRETTYNQIMRNIPPYFEYASNVIRKFDSSELCDYAYSPSTNYKMNNDCKTVINGLLLKGITGTNAYFYQQARQIELKFDGAKTYKQRDANFLKQMIRNEEIIEIIDAKLIILAPIFDQLKTACLESVVQYFENQRNQLLIIYVMFLTIITIAVIYFLLKLIKRLRETMWNTNLMLKIIPQTDLCKEDQELIKKFFIN